MERTVGLVGLVVVGAIGLGYVWQSAEPPEPQPVPTLEQSVESSGVILVHVSGAVAAPGVVSIPLGSRVADAVAAAGGVTPEAVLVAINLAAVVHDGEQVIVPTESGSEGQASDGRVAINSADAAELEALPGVGPVLADRIVAFRTQHGPFTVTEDLLDVPGIGEAKLASIRDLVRIP